jgi:hypothetical protein
MADLAEERTVPAIIMDHEGRLCTLEKGYSDMNKQVDKMDAKLDKITLLEWGVIIAIVASIVAEHIHF